MPTGKTGLSAWRRGFGAPIRRLRDRISARNRWVAEHYTPYGLAQREEMMLAIARFCHINRPVEGCYFEFGSHEAKTMRLAWKHMQHLFNFDFVSFDSFEGLPDIEPIDRQEIWAKGRLKTAEAEFRRICRGAGMPDERLITIKGFYADSLNEATKSKLAGKKAAVAYIDCDLYASTVPCLNFIRDFLQPGTIIVFDDWNCFLGDPERGERLAWAEFTAANADLKFVPWISSAELQSFIYVGPRKG